MGFRLIVDVYAALYYWLQFRYERAASENTCVPTRMCEIPVIKYHILISSGNNKGLLPALIVKISHCHIYRRPKSQRRCTPNPQTLPENIISLR